MKKLKKLAVTLLVLTMALLSVLTACEKTPNENHKDPSHITSGDTNGGGAGNNENSNGNENNKNPLSITYRSDYNPTTFNKASVSNEVTEITDGVIVSKNVVVKNNNHKSIVYAIEVDLTKVTIAAGSKENTTAISSMGTIVPSAQADAYKNATGKEVYAYLNADFFGGNVPVNAFVKDGVIVKDSHNDKNLYDYKNLDSDVPASAPMLFGVKGNSAQIAPMIAYKGDITKSEVKKPVIQAKLSYIIAADGMQNGYAFLEEKESNKDGIVFNKKMAKKCKAGDYALKVDITNGVKSMKVLSVEKCENDKPFTPKNNYAYVYVGKNVANVEQFIASETLSTYVTSEDGTWKGYTTILGCRQSLVENGAVAKTVTLENSNGAQSADVPRSAVGVKVDGKVVIFAVESLYYGKKAAAEDTHGMNLPELADFMAYYGVKNGANFDGGGSTQLTTVKGGAKTVLVRSSDTGSSDASSTRKVINTILVVEK